MSYYIARTVPLDFEAAVSRTEEALKGEGFGIISRIDIQEALRSKIGAKFRPYTILGACNPTLAHQALQLEDKVGTMLPCNVVVQQTVSGETEVAAVDPVASMTAIDNPALKQAAEHVREKLEKAISSLA
ncbi:DUF302 domain-containing protein [Sphingomonas parva]|uniref:DUF302 domain-containing protein n=1 Tax=Sphingomonas parva TaxID=2555898 RepID=A0A4Y8ZUP7_9SPHN|nr:DUF302 domain-containing protein [Sphingomonas parva]TFI59740.1 DUF302 domain-containing protein [Sphingomonas parva]